MKEILIPPHEVDFTCGSYFHHGAGAAIFPFLLTSYGMIDVILRRQVVFVM